MDEAKSGGVLPGMTNAAERDLVDGGVGRRSLALCGLCRPLYKGVDAQ
jgi:hypothetical protein